MYNLRGRSLISYQQVL